MSKKNVFKSTKKAIKHAYIKTVAAYGSLSLIPTALYLDTQRIAESYVPNGIWNPEAWQQCWGFDGLHASIALVLAGVSALTIGVFAVADFGDLYDNSKAVTKIDKDNKKIIQTRQGLFGKKKTKEQSLEYDVILSVDVNQGCLEKKANVGTVRITTAELVEKESKNCEGNSKLEQKFVTIPLQEGPYKIREQILEGQPSYKDLKARLGHL